jgi:hypothetical protein
MNKRMVPGLLIALASLGCASPAAAVDLLDAREQPRPSESWNSPPSSCAAGMT